MTNTVSTINAYIFMWCHPYTRKWVATYRERTMPTAEYRTYASDATLIAAIEDAINDTDESESEYIRKATVQRLIEDGYLEEADV